MMKKYIIAGFVFFSLALCACSAKEPEGVDEEKDTGIEIRNRYYDAFEALDKGDYDEAIGLFMEALDQDAAADSQDSGADDMENSAEVPDRTGLLGLARSQIGAGLWEEAAVTLEEMSGYYPGDTSVLSYQGEVYTELGDYDSAVTAFYELMKSADGDEHARNRLVTALWQTEGLERIYDISRELYMDYPEEEGYLRNYLWSAACLNGTRNDELLEDVAGKPGEYAVTTLLRAYELIKSGETDAAEALLTDREHFEELTEAGYLFYGDTEGRDGQGDVVAVADMFGNTGVMYGRMQSGRWAGDCSLFRCASSDTTRKRRGEVVATGTRYYLYTYRGTWSAGVPEGLIKYTANSDTEYDDPQYNNYQVYRADFEFAGGAAEGRTELVRYDIEDGIEREEYTEIHLFENGAAVPFEAETEDGPQMVYELQMDEGRVWSYETDDCGHSYIWADTEVHP